MRISGPRDGRSHGSAYEPEPLDADEREGGIAEIRPSDVVHFHDRKINLPAKPIRSVRSRPARMRGSITRKVNVIRSADSTLYPMKFYRCQSLRAAGMIRTNYGLANRLAPPLM